MELDGRIYIYPEGIKTGQSEVTPSGTLQKIVQKGRREQNREIWLKII